MVALLPPVPRAAQPARHRGVWLFWEGIGVWGNNSPVGWAWDITNFVCWIGIGHAGTLISAILFLFRQKWRTSINRFAEAMTHLRGHLRADLPRHPRRPRLATPTGCSRCPNQMGIWPNFQSPLLWDVFAVSTYFTVSLAVLVRRPDPRPRDAARPRDDARSGRSSTALFALGWRGSNRHWRTTRRAYLILAAHLDAAGALGALGRVVRLRRLASCPAGTPRSSRRTSSPAPSSPASRWCMTLLVICRAGVRPRGPDHDEAPRAR